MTDATIGIKIGDKVIYTICGGLGFLYHTGVILNNYYDTAEKAKELVNSGFIHTLGPKMKDDSNSGIDFNLINYAYFDFLKEKITLIEPSSFKAEEVDISLYPSIGQQYNYLFDATDTNQWYVCSPIINNSGNSLIKFKLSEVLSNAEVRKCYTRGSGNQETKEAIVSNQRELRMSSIKYINNCLSQIGLKDYAIDYSKSKSGDTVYGLYKTVSGKNKRRKCIAKSPYIYQLIMYMAYYYTGEAFNLAYLREHSSQYKNLLQIEVIK